MSLYDYPADYGQETPYEEVWCDRCEEFEDDCICHTQCERCKEYGEECWCTSEEEAV